jgi:thioredoxin 1
MALKIRKKRKPGQPAPTSLPDGEVLHVDDRSFSALVLDASTPVLVDFWAPWCGPCRRVAPVVDELAKGYAGAVRCVKLNIDESPQTARRYGVRSIPTLSVFQGGQIRATFVGVQPKRVLADALDRALD